jgi:hypothetical protein
MARLEFQAAAGELQVAWCWTRRLSRTYTAPKEPMDHGACDLIFRQLARVEQHRLTRSKAESVIDERGLPMTVHGYIGCIKDA